MKVLITFTKDPITINFVGGPAMIYGYVNGYLFDRNLPDGAADNSKPHHLRKVRTDQRQLRSRLRLRAHRARDARRREELLSAGNLRQHLPGIGAQMSLGRRSGWHCQ
jgi:hypothetical protein